MGSKVTKFISRSPRYTLNPNDNRFLRYAHEHDKGQSFTTRYLDISQTGLAFITDREHAPHVSDLIKVEIPLSDTESVAWWARVVRVEEYESQRWHAEASPQDGQAEPQVVVAIQFHELPPGHARVIREQLDKKFNEVYEQERRRRFRNFSLFLVGNFWKFFLYLICTVATFWFLHHFAQPDLIYTKDKGSPWGQRFPQFLLQESKDKK